MYDPSHYFPIHQKITLFYLVVFEAGSHAQKVATEAATRAQQAAKEAGKFGAEVAKGVAEELPGAVADEVRTNEQFRNDLGELGKYILDNPPVTTKNQEPWQQFLDRVRDNM